MAVSKKRGGAKAHRAKVQQRNLNKKSKETKQRKDFMEMMQRAQAEYEATQENKNIVTADELGVGDGLELNLDDDFVIQDDKSDFIIDNSENN